ACFFGDGVYEATPVRNFHPFMLDAHVDRFYNNMGLLRLKKPMEKAELKSLLREMCAKLDDGDQLLYWQLSRGSGPRTHAFPGDDVASSLWITIQPKKLLDLTKKIGLITVPDTRFLHCNIKTLNLLVNVLAAQKAQEAGCYEAVFHRGDRVTECSHSNVHILQDGVLRTAPTDQYILPGIARANVIAACKDLGIPVDETAFTLDEMRAADEVLVSSSTAFLLQAHSIDGQKAGGRAEAPVAAIREWLMRQFVEATD
ncbi:MAG: D-amino acid aminotransferase, partial [Clostridiales bacterium]|nr:D-amino acid aminotransferase [Clostridiales bacterium]